MSIYEGTYDDPANEQPHLTRKDNYLRVTGYVDYEGDYEDLSRWLLVQENLRGSDCWFENFRTATGALTYAADLSELYEGWRPVAIIDLDTGVKYEVRAVANPIFTMREVLS